MYKSKVKKIFKQILISFTKTHGPVSKKSRLHKLAQPKQKNELVKENPIHSAIEKKPHWKW